MPRDVRHYEGTDKRRRETGRRLDPQRGDPPPAEAPASPPPKEPRGSLL